MAQIGEIIDGRYEILREIGGGGMSVVYLGLDRHVSRLYAIKQPRGNINSYDYQLMLKSLAEEAHLMKKLDHPTLPRIVDIIQSPTTVYIVMDYIEGEPMEKVLEKRGAQSEENVIKWAKQLCDVLHYLHTRIPPIIYRDMKPSNIMLKPDGTVRLLDFGIAREYKEGRDSDTELLGTRGYASPESFGGKGQTDRRTDIYSLGVTLYHMVTGQNPSEPPYEIYPIRHWNPYLSEGLEKLIIKCTQLNPADRFQSCSEISYYLDNLKQLETENKKKTNYWLIPVIAIGALILIIGVVLIAVLGRNEIKPNNNNNSSSVNNSTVTEQAYEPGTVEYYVNAIEQNPSNPEAYEGLMDIMYALSSKESVDGDENNFAILPDDVSADAEYDYRISYEAFEDWFSDEHLEKVKNVSLEKYIRLNTDKGRLLWDYYGLESGVRSEAIPKAHSCFKKAITLNINNATNAVNQAEYNRTLIYYLVSYFQVHKDEIRNTDNIDSTFTVDDTEKRIIQLACSNENKEIYSYDYYNCYWSTLSNCVDLLYLFANSAMGSEISDEATLDCINLIIDTCSDPRFNAESMIDDQSVITMLGKLKEIANKLEIRIKNCLDTDSLEELTKRMVSFKQSYNLVCTIFMSNNYRNLYDELDNFRYKINEQEED